MADVLGFCGSVGLAPPTLPVIWNLLRFVALVEASVCMWFTGIVLLRYRKRYLQAAKTGTAGRRQKVPGRRGPEDPRHADTDWIGLLPLHVWMVTASTLLLVAGEVGTISSRLGSKAVWNGTPLALIAFTLLLASLVTIARYENRVTGR